MAKVKVSTEFKLGIIVVLGVLVLYLGTNYLKGFNLLEEQRTFYAVYDNIDGLVESNPVTYKGYKVGQVKSINLVGKRSGELTVAITIFEKDLKIPEDTRAEVYSSDLLGSKAIKLKLGNSQEFAANEDTLVSSTQATLQESVNREVLPIKRKAEELLSSMDSMVGVVTTILNAETRRNLTSSFRSVGRVLKSLEKTSYRLDTLVAHERKKISEVSNNLASITSNLENKNAEVSNTFDNLSAISDTLAKADLVAAVNNANEALEDIQRITTKVQEGKGSLGKLVQEDSLHNSLLQASNDLDLLLKDLREHPDRYVHFSVFGGGDKGLDLSRKERKQLEQLLEEKKQKANDTK